MIRHLIEHIHDWAGEQLDRLIVADVHPQERDDEAELRRYIADDSAYKRYLDGLED